ncbi:hypothetical protein PYCC9005_005686 [Savitreella phatthalungensis]
MARFRPLTPGAVCLIVAFVLLLLTVISAPITRFSSLGSASGVKFGVFGYCTNKGVCSSVQIGYAMDSVLNSQTAYARRQLTSSSTGNSGGGAAGTGTGSSSTQSTATSSSALSNSNFNLPSSARNGLSNVLIVHVVAAGLTLVLLFFTLVAHVRGPADSPAFLTSTFLLSLLTFLLTLLAFLVDILIFVPNIDWGTWATLVATIFNAAGAMLICAGKRSLSARKAMRARRIANDEPSGFQMQQPSSPRAETEDDMLAKATVPRFAQFEVAEHDSRESLEPSMRSEQNPTLSRPPVYDSAFRLPHRRNEAQTIPAVDTAMQDSAYDEGFASHGTFRHNEPRTQYHDDIAFADSDYPNEPYADDGQYEPPTLGVPEVFPAGQPGIPNQRRHYDGYSTPPRQPRSPGTVSNSSHFTSVSQRGINPRWAADNPYEAGQQQQRSMVPRRPGGTGLPRPPSQRDLQAEATRRRHQQQDEILAGNPDFQLSSGAGLPSTRRLPRRAQVGPSRLGPGTTSGAGLIASLRGNDPYAIAKIT